MTLGGEYRARVESFANRNYTTADESYYSQRLNFHASLKIGARVRLFGELYHGLTSGADRILEDDDLAVHQGFLELTLIEKENANMSLRLGRQEIGYGVSRLIDVREGPDIRRSFDMANLTFSKNQNSFNIIYGKEVNTGFQAFDNESNLFQSNAPNPSLWGVYIKNKVTGRIGNLDFYYLGFNSETSRFNDVIGEETRHSIGIRSYGNVGRFSFNSELIYQFGEIGERDISAYNFETDWKYLLLEGGWQPKLGIRLDFSSGDQAIGDGKVQTFNPMFVNPALYSLAGVNTPANLSSFHPNLTLQLSAAISIYMDYAFFYRTQTSDGLYTPPRFLLRAADGADQRHIGDVIGLQIQYNINRNISCNLRSSYFIAGEFIEATGASENTFYIFPTTSFKF
ncbi:MAG: alginate export family protein [Cyclobacteriaceae bacterium]